MSELVETTTEILDRAVVGEDVASSVIRSTLLSKLNERQVFQALQAQGPMSRAEVARYSGISAPTASKAIEALLRAGLLEEGAADIARGRPARKLTLATRTVQALGLVIDAGECRVVAAGLDGRLESSRLHAFPTPDTYEELLRLAAETVCRFTAQPDVATLGLGISIPGLIDYSRGRGLLSPNLPLTNGQSPARDLTERLGIECVIMQESHALCLAERQFGSARGLDDFAMMDVCTGIGLGVFSNGRLLVGHSGLAGEVGHITVELDGRPCGCGNRGCLETVASDAAFAGAVSRRLGRHITLPEAMALLSEGRLQAQQEMERTLRYLAIGIAAVINLFNPSTLFVHSRMFFEDEARFARLIEEAGKRALSPSFADCRIVQARGSKRQGAVAAIIEHVTNSIAPDLAAIERDVRPQSVAAVR